MYQLDSDTVSEIQTSDLDSSMTLEEDNETLGWESLPEIMGSSDEDNISDLDDKMTTPGLL